MSKTTTTLERLSSGPLFAALLLAPLALGTVHTVWVLAVLLLLLVASTATIVRSRQGSHAIRLTPIAGLFLLFASWCLVQVILLPGALVGMISSHGHTLFEDGWRVAFGGSTTAWRTISMDPGQTADRGLRFLALALAAFTTANLRHRGRVWRRAFTVIAAAAGLSLVVGLGHLAMGQTMFFGFYQAVIPPKMSTFVSGNHAASLFGLASLVSLAGAYRGLRIGERRNASLAAIAGMIFFVAMVESDSAGATLLFGLSALVFGLVALKGTLRIPRPLAAALIGIPVFVVALALIVVDNVRDTELGDWIFNSSDTRLELARAALSASSDYWLVGSGAGSVDRVLIPYINWDIIGVARVPTIENEWVEFILTMGWPVMLLGTVMGALMFLILRADPDESERRRFFRGLGLGLWTYTLGLGFLHFPFFALGVSLPMVVGVEACIRQLYHFDEAPKRRGFWQFRGRYRMAPIVAILGFALAIANSGFDTPTDAPEQASQADLQRWLTWIPGESQIFVALSRKAREAGDFQRFMELSRHARTLEPTPRFDLYLAFAYLSVQQQPEALKLYQDLADGPLAGRAAIEAARYIDDPALVAEVLKAHPNLWKYANVELTKSRGRAASIAFATRLVELRPDVSEPYEILVRGYWSTNQLELAEIWSRYLVIQGLNNTTGQGPQGYGIWIQTLQRQGERTQAAELAAQAFQVVPGDPLVGNAVLELRTPKATDATPEEVERVAEAMAIVCRPPVSEGRRKICLMVESWVAEAKSDDTAAVRALRTVMTAYDDPRPLVRYYEGRTQCLSIRTVLRGLAADHPHRTAVETAIGRCGKVPE